MQLWLDKLTSRLPDGWKVELQMRFDYSIIAERIDMRVTDHFGNSYVEEDLWCDPDRLEQVLYMKFNEMREWLMGLEI